MLRFIILLLASVSISAIASSMRSTEAMARPLRIATYNVENLFDGIRDNPHNPKEKPKSKRQLQALAKTFHVMNADVVVMQEVESLRTLRTFRDQYLKDMGYREAVVVEGNDKRGIDVALLSRLPVISVKSHKQVKFQVAGRMRGFSRDLLQVQVKAPTNYSFTIFAAHLKAKHGGLRADTVRAAEAQAIQHILTTFQHENPRANFLLMGDLNDTPEAIPLKSLLSPTNSLGLVDLVAFELGIKPTVFTYHPKKYRSRIDYILVSPAMMPEYRARSVTILQYPEAYLASDHLPILAEFFPQERS